MHSGSQFLEPDGWFPNHVPNPEDKTAMAAGVHAVQQSGSDLGVVLDTDVDRSAVVARDGQPINSNRYIALMSLITLRYACWGPAHRHSHSLWINDLGFHSCVLFMP